MAASSPTPNSPSPTPEASNCGAVGIVVDGFVRDQAGVAEAGVPVFARGAGVRLNQGAYELADIMARRTARKG